MVTLMTYSGHFDGASRGNPGEAGAGALLYDGEGNIIWQKTTYLGSKTNNEAEYEGLLMLLREIRERNIEQIVIRGDSRLVICQMKKEWKVASPHLKILWEEAQRLIRGRSIAFEWVPREENSDADCLSNQAIDKHSADKPSVNVFDPSRLEKVAPSIFIAHGTEDYAVDVKHKACTCLGFMHQKRCKHLDAALSFLNGAKS